MDTTIIIACFVALVPIVFCAVYFSSINIIVHEIPNCVNDPKFLPDLQPPITRGLFASIITGFLLLGIGIGLIVLKIKGRGFV